MAINDWSAASLCVDSDLTGLESKAITWGKEGHLGRFREEAKIKIGNFLKAALIAQDKATDETEVLDLIEDYEPLREPATLMALHILCNECILDGGDKFERKASYYLNEYEKAIPKAVDRLSLDLDEDDSISSSEEFNLNLGCTFTR